jgi:phage gpG-like protein
MKLTITVEGVDEQIKGLEYVERGLVDFRQLGAWKAVASEFRKIEKEQFDSQGSKGASGKWAPLKTGYAAIKSARYGQQPILQASKKLYRSLTSEGAEGAVYEESATELTLGTSIPYAGHHQKGTRKMPAREVISLTRDQQQRLVQPVHEKLKQLIANARLRDLRGF